MHPGNPVQHDKAQPSPRHACHSHYSTNNPIKSLAEPALFFLHPFPFHPSILPSLPPSLLPSFLPPSKRRAIASVRDHSITPTKIRSVHPSPMLELMTPRQQPIFSLPINNLAIG
ncbi:unnamed protein product [Tuber melanosporum]|uniref:(Perigord truffle) hypothetical protein n=1 Tax=Tuber melanosporum (strain Mel28) TaxID=656061 RepID=D5GC82_TUBMM|nr:uncharacterized protein GSTUM_00000634001 [Tuber melanosporum]CAZ82125.1 unnamed protein product [Tuber melanosporum]